MKAYLVWWEDENNWSLVLANNTQEARTVAEKHLGFTVGVAELLCDPSAGKPRVVRIPR